MADDKVRRRLHSFERPWDNLQIATWFLFPVVLLHFYLFIIPLNTTWGMDLFGVQLMVILIFSIAACSAVYASYSTCYTDPADDALVFKPYDTANNSRVNTAFGGLGALQFCQSCVSQSATSPAVTDSVDGANNTTSSKSYLPVDTNVIFCYICEAHVHMSAKHCRYCDKCVVNFDHHCKWLNTCVGSKNYATFLMLVASITTLITVSFSCSIVHMVNIFTAADNSDFHHRVANDSLLAPLSVMALKIVLCVTLALLLLILVMLIQLLSFHLMLIYRGQTTYDYIVSEQKRAREARNIAAAKKINAANKQRLEQAPADDIESGSNPTPAPGSTDSVISSDTTRKVEEDPASDVSLSNVNMNNRAGARQLELVNADNQTENL